MNVHTPHNKVAYMLCLAAGLEMLHGGIIRQAVKDLTIQHFQCPDLFHFVVTKKIMRFQTAFLMALLRLRTGGQLPLTFIKSLDTDTGGGGGKGQGKSGAAQAIGYLTGNPETTLSPTVSKQEIKKTTSSTTLPQCLEDIKDSNKLSEICAWQYESQVYRTAAGQYQSKCEIYGTGNSCRLDECHGDRVRVITFRCWSGAQQSQGFTERRAKFTDVIRKEERPTRFTIGEAGDFFRSDDYLLGRTEFAALLQELCQVVKMRTLEQGYAGLLSTLRFIIKTFGAACPVSEGEVVQWVEEVWVEQIRRQHVEKGNAIHCLLRFLQGVLELTDDMPSTQVKKFLRISTTTKLQDKFCLCLFPDPKLPLVTQKGVELEMVREHLLAQGGAIDRSGGGGGKPGQGLFVRDSVDDDDDSVVVDPTNKEQCSYKKCLLIPLSLLPSKVIMDFADRTGQQEHYSLFGADAGTPSVLSEFGGQRSDNTPHNSTSAGLDSSLDLHITDDISTIQPRNEAAFDTQEIEGEDLRREEEVEKSDCSGNESETSAGSTQQKTSVDLDSSMTSSQFGDGSRQQNNARQSQEGGSRQQDLTGLEVSRLNATAMKTKMRGQAADVNKRQLDQTFDENEISVFSLATKRTKMKANKTTTQSIGQKEYFPCPDCKKPLTTPSALTRHVKSGKCTPSATFNQGIVVKCPLCPKICQSTGGLVRHTKSAHADNVSLVSNTLPLRPKAKAAAARKTAGASTGALVGELAASEGESATSAEESSKLAGVSNTVPLRTTAKAATAQKATEVGARVLPVERLTRARAVEKVIFDVQYVAIFLSKTLMHILPQIASPS